VESLQSQFHEKELLHQQAIEILSAELQIFKENKESITFETEKTQSLKILCDQKSIEIQQLQIQIQEKEKNNS